MAVIVFISFLLILCVITTIIKWSGGKGINLSEEGMSTYMNNTKQKVYLDPDSYQILNEFGVFRTQNSTFLFPIEYYYFNVLVDGKNGSRFVIAVRTNKKTEDLRNGKSVFLNGMMSKLDDDTTAKQLSGLNVPFDVDEVYSYCLNDND